MAVGLEERESVIRVEVLELEEALLAEEASRRDEELLDEALLAIVDGIHLGATSRRRGDALLLETGVEGVVTDDEAISVAVAPVAARVDDQRDRAVRVDARADCVEVELSYWDAHTPRSQVAQPEDAPAVGKDDAVAQGLAVGADLELRLGVLLEHLAHAPAVRD